MTISTLLSYRNLFFHSILSLSLSFLISFSNLSVLFLQGLFTYIHPENLSTQTDQSNFRAAIRRPQEAPDLKRRSRSKDKPDFDESNAQIFRLRLDDSHLKSRLLFPQFASLFLFTSLSLSNLLLQTFILPHDSDSGVFSKGSTIPILLGSYTISKAYALLATASFQRSASKRSEKQVSILLGFLGFLSVLWILSNASSSFFDFDFGFHWDSGSDSTVGIAKILIAVFAGCLAGFLYTPALKIARSFWLGTDQFQWNLSVISCGPIARMLLYANLLMILFVSFIWINPLAVTLVKNSNSNSNGGTVLSGNVGMARSDFVKFRVWCIMISGILQILALRPNLQMYLNEAVLSWYQRLHSSKVPDLDFSRAKIFLHNHYLCLSVLQLFAPPVLVLLFLGFSQIEGNLFAGLPFIDGFAHHSSLMKEVALFMAWWIVFVSAIFTSTSLALYRCGIWFIY